MTMTSTTTTTHDATATTTDDAPAFDFIDGMKFDYANRTFRLDASGDAPVITDVATQESHDTTWATLCEARDRGELTQHDEADQ